MPRRVCASSRAMFQSTRPRGTRQVEQVLIGDALLVSIHASARDATLFRRPRPNRHARFNPRVREGRDPTGAMSRTTTARFNPRVREGRDVDGYLHGARHRLVSIHASARDATRAVRPAARREHGFQSTRPRGTRLVLAVERGFALTVSIHASARDATRELGVQILAEQLVSIHASARDATGLFFGSSRLSGEGGLDLQEEIG